MKNFVPLTIIRAPGVEKIYFRETFIWLIFQITVINTFLSFFKIKTLQHILILDYPWEGLLYSSKYQNDFL